jgi:VWFA-related protein
MNGIRILASQPWIGRLGWTLLHFLWQGTAIAVLYTTARFLFARHLSPRTRYGFACTALLAMTAAPPLTFLTISNTAIEPAQVAAWIQPVAEWRWLAPAVVAFWVAGMLGFSIRLLGAFRFTRRLRATAYAAPAIWQQALDRIAAQMGGAQGRLMGSSMVNVPTVIGYLRPIILVPVAFLTGIPAEHVIALLTHEMAHIRRNDYIACILQSIAEVVLFYHPAVWWISGQIRTERELCCDDMAIACGADALTYARALTELESRRPVRLATQLAANGGSLVDRIRRLIEPEYTGGHYLPGTGSALAMLLLWMVGAAVAAAPGTQTTVAPPAASLADTFVPPLPARIPVPASGAPGSLLDQAQKTLLFDPVFSAQLAQPQAAGIGGEQARVAGRPAIPPTRFVVEAVTARNADGGIIEGLRKEDFAVVEDGNTQELSLFDFENVEGLAAAAPPLAPAAAGRALPRLPHAGLAAESKDQLRYKDHRLVVLYFDMTSMQTPDRLRALDAAQKFIGTQMSSVDMLCLMRNAGAGVEVLQDFTADRDRLLSVVATLAAGVTGGADAWLADSGLTIPAADGQLAALRAAAKMLGGLNEKKALVYISSGLNLIGTDNQAMLRATVLDAVRAGVSVWPRDTRDAAPGQPALGQEALNTLGSETGGGVTPDGSDIAAGIAAAERSIASYYIVGYSATDNARDGRYRRVKVTLNNNTEAKLDYRQGYFAGNEFGPPAADADGKERQLQDALLMGEPVTDLTVAAEVNYFRQNNAEYFAPITLKIPGSELAPSKKNGAELTTLEFVGEVKDEFGAAVTRFRDVMQVGLADSTATELAKRPVTYNTGVILLPGKYSIKILARDNATGRVGEYLGKFAVANLNRDAQLPITSVVLSSQLVDDATPTAFMGGVKPKPIQPPVNPLVQDGKRMIPSVTRVFSSKSDMYVYLQAFERGATTTAPLMARVAFYKGPVKVMETSGVMVSDGLDPKSKMLPIRMDVGLGSLKPGEYDCQVTVVDPATQKSATWQKPVTVVP